MRKLTVEELNRMDIEAFHQSEKLPLVIVLDNIRSLHNDMNRVTIGVAEVE